MFMLRSQNKITAFFMILTWACPFNNRLSFKNKVCDDNDPWQADLKSKSRTTDNIYSYRVANEMNRVLGHFCAHTG